jgi:hypothetical protein
MPAASLHTPRLNIPYPAGTDQADVPTHLHDIATIEDGLVPILRGPLSARPAAGVWGRLYLSGVNASNALIPGDPVALWIDTGAAWFPATAPIPLGGWAEQSLRAPQEGDEFYLTVDNGPSGIWHLRYDSATSTWAFAGGMPIHAEDDTNCGTTATTYGDPTSGTAGPSIVLPSGGDYLISYGFLGTGAPAGNTLCMSIQIGATAAVDADSIQVGPAQTASVMRTRRKNLGTSGTPITITCKYRGVTNAGMTFMLRWIEAVPIRLRGI